MKSIVVIGAAGPKADEPTQFGSEFGDKFSAALAKQAKEFQVWDRGDIRQLVKKAGVSEVMVVADGLANWIATKVGVDGYVVVEFAKVSNGTVEILTSLYRIDKEDGYFLNSADTEIDLTLEQYTEGLRPIGSDWDKPTHPESELKQLPAGNQPTCISCPKPEFTDLERRVGGIHEVVSLFLTVYPDGRVGDIAIVKSGKYGITGKAVDTILKTWRMKPALDNDGKVMAYRINVAIAHENY